MSAIAAGRTSRDDSDTFERDVTLSSGSSSAYAGGAELEAVDDFMPKRSRIDFDLGAGAAGSSLSEPSELVFRLPEVNRAISKLTGAGGATARDDVRLPTSER